MFNNYKLFKDNSWKIKLDAFQNGTSKVSTDKLERTRLLL